MQNLCFAVVWIFFLTCHYRYSSFPFFEAFSLYPDLLSRVCFTRTGIKMFRYANICGFSLLSPYKIAVHEIHVFLLKIILPFTRRSGQHKETTGQVFRFPCRRMVCAAVQGKRCQSVSSEEEKKLPDELQNWGQQRDSRSGMTATICSLQHNFHIHKGLPRWYCYVPQARSFLWRADGLLFPWCLNLGMSVLLSLF